MLFVLSAGWHLLGVLNRLTRGGVLDEMTDSASVGPAASCFRLCIPAQDRFCGLVGVVAAGLIISRPLLIVLFRLIAFCFFVILDYSIHF